MNNCTLCKGKEDLKNKYLIPNKEVKEIVLMIDGSSKLGLLDLKSHTLCLNKLAIEISSNIFEENLDLSNILENNSNAETWINDLLKEEIFEVVDKKPIKTVLSNYQIKSGDTVNVGSLNNKVEADMDGEVSKIQLYIYLKEKKNYK